MFFSNEPFGSQKKSPQKSSFDQQTGVGTSKSSSFSTTLWFWRFWVQIAPHLNKYIIPGSLAPPMSQGRQFFKTPQSVKFEAKFEVWASWRFWVFYSWPFQGVFGDLQLDFGQSRTVVSAVCNSKYYAQTEENTPKPYFRPVVIWCQPQVDCGLVNNPALFCVFYTLFFGQDVAHTTPFYTLLLNRMNTTILRLFMSCFWVGRVQYFSLL